MDDSSEGESSDKSLGHDDLIVTVPNVFDQTLYASIHACDGTKLDDEEKKLCDDKILMMKVTELRQLCRKCMYVKVDNPAPKKAAGQKCYM